MEFPTYICPWNKSIGSSLNECIQVNTSWSVLIGNKLDNNAAACAILFIMFSPSTSSPPETAPSKNPQAPSFTPPTTSIFNGFSNLPLCLLDLSNDSKCFPRLISSQSAFLLLDIPLLYRSCAILVSVSSYISICPTPIPSESPSAPELPPLITLSQL